jgi:hypothetical protein
MRWASVAVSVAAVMVIAFSATALPDAWRAASAEREHWAAVAPIERETAFITRIPLRLDILEFWRRNMRATDRYFIQIPPGAFGPFADKPTIVRTAGRPYLLPAVEVIRPEDADVILSWDADPGLLSLRYSAQIRAGLQLIFVSRVADE